MNWSARVVPTAALQVLRAMTPALRAGLPAAIVAWPSIASAQAWMNTSLTPAARAQLLLGAMSQDQELAMVHGVSGSYVGDVAAVSALNIPALNLEDGPAGVADGTTQVTVFPAPINIAASWDLALAQSYAQAMGQEQAAKGTNVVLGPMMNMDRVPQGGRVFEGFGEDPVLASAMAAAMVDGIQSQGLIATAKHYIGNEQETDRMTVSSVIDDRTLHEIYLPPFAASVDAGVGAIMCSYNQVNGVFACENPATLAGWLDGELGFKGFVMSDWTATHSTVPSADAGLDMEMPGSTYYGSPLSSALTSGALAKSVLDDMVLRILTSMFTAGLFDRAPNGSLSSDVQSTAHTALARSAAAEATVILSNSGVLPIDTGAIHSIAVIGAAADSSPIYQGLGSSMVTISSGTLVTPRKGITSRAGSGISVGYAEGASSPYSDATSLASQSDMAVVVVGVTSSEGSDRSTLSLPSPADDLIAAVAAASAKTVVVVYAPAQVMMPWAHEVAAVLYGGLPGQEEGDALADVLFGDVNPSGKLPFTIAASATDYPASTSAQFPGIGGTAIYSEGFLVGYRWFDSSGTAPLFPFGHGLSYTTFAYANLSVAPDITSPSGDVSVSFDVSNTGNVAGAEVAQLYVGLPSPTSEPPQQLEAFQRVMLMPGQSQHVSFTLASGARTFWSAGLRGPVAYPGTYQLAVGSSSRDIRLQGSFVVQGGPLAGTLHSGAAAALCCGATLAGSDAALGGGYVTGYTAAGAAATFQVNVPDAGPCPITARYSVAEGAQSPQPEHTLSLYANGAKVSQIAFPPLANLSTWDFVTETVSLNAGSNTVAFVQDTGDTGNVNLDEIIDCNVPPSVTADGGSDGGASLWGATVPVSDAAGSDAECLVACAPPPSPAPNPGCGCRITGRPVNETGTRCALWVLGAALAWSRRRARLTTAPDHRADPRRPAPQKAISCP